tara:strand:+ start:239 stop:1660 length:1422 start_codon:yes stop_codon:yes gene_type:complete
MAIFPNNMSMYNTYDDALRRQIELSNRDAMNLRNAQNVSQLLPPQGNNMMNSIRPQARQFQQQAPKQGLLGRFNNAMGNLPMSGNLGLLAAGASLLDGGKIGDAVQAGLGTYQGLSEMEERKKRQAAMVKIVESGDFSQEEQALIAASQNPAAVAVQIKNSKKAAKNTVTSQRKELADQFELTGEERKSYLLTGKLPEKPKNDKTALQKNYEFFKKLKPKASEEEILKYLKGGDTFNLGNDVQVKGDYAIIKDPTSDLGVRFEVIPGSKTDILNQNLAKDKTQIKDAKQAANEGQSNSSMLVLDEISRAREAITANPFLTTGFIGQITENIGGTPANNLKALLDPIKANIGFDRLQRMRTESPTGGALGQVAVRELEFLQAVFGSLEQSQNSGQLQENLTRLEEQYKDSLARIYNGALQAQRDGEINSRTNKVITPLDFFSESEIETLFSKEEKTETNNNLNLSPDAMKWMNK